MLARTQPADARSAQANLTPATAMGLPHILRSSSVKELTCQLAWQQLCRATRLLLAAAHAGKSSSPQPQGFAKSYRSNPWLAANPLLTQPHPACVVMVSQVQSDWCDGGLDIVVATVAFGEQAC